jgi:ABC-type sugar transport system ATPase subunit
MGAKNNMVNPTPFFRAIEISKKYPGTLALDRVNFDLYPGEVHALVGENGAGKSTLMSILAGVIKPDGGTLQMDGNPIQLRDPHDAQAKGISIVFQELALSPNMSVAENIFTNSQPVGRSGLINFNKMYDQAHQTMESFGVDLNSRAPLRNYSLAVQQIVEITRATHRKARVLLLDEPTSAIGQRETEQLFQVIRSLSKSGVGVVYVSHKLDEVFAISDRITVLKDGKWMATVNTADTSVDEVVHFMVGRDLKALFPERDNAQGTPVLEARNLSGGKFSDISLTAYAGQILGLFGLTGAGRTELARAIFGIDPVLSGEILLDGQVVKVRHPGDAMRLGITYITEDRKIDGLFLEMSIRNNIAATNLEQVSQGEFINNRRLNRLTQELVERLQIKVHNLEQGLNHVSGGNQQKVLFSKWLARNPKVLIADEPTRGVDVGSKADIHRLLYELARQGAAVVMISSELPEIMGLSDRIVVMHQGHLVAQYLPNDVTEDQIVASAISLKTVNSNSH